MKKILSMFLISCMLFGFTVSAQDPTGMKYVLTKTSTGATLDIIVEGKFSEVSEVIAIIGYNSDKVTLDTETPYVNNTKALEKSEGKDDYKDKSQAPSKITSTEYKAYYKYDYGYFGTNETCKFENNVSDTYTFATFYFKMVEGQTLEKNDIAVAKNLKRKNGSMTQTVNTKIACANSLQGDSLTITPEYVGFETDPTFTVASDSVNPSTDGGIVEITTPAKGETYTVKAAAPIGKQAVIYINGVAVPTGKGKDAYQGTYTGTFTEDTTVKVEYKPVDAENNILTWVIPMDVVYGSDNGIAAFGKGTIGENDDYGIEFSGGDFAEAKKYSAKAKNITPMGDIFAVEVGDAGKGDYHARAYIGNAYGNKVDFTK